MLGGAETSFGGLKEEDGFGGKLGFFVSSLTRRSTFKASLQRSLKLEYCAKSSSFAMDK